MTEQHTHEDPHSHQHEHGGVEHTHPHTDHEHEHVEHEHTHTHHDGTEHTHSHLHQRLPSAPRTAPRRRDGLEQRTASGASATVASGGSVAPDRQTTLGQ